MAQREGMLSFIGISDVFETPEKTDVCLQWSEKSAEESKTHY